MKIIRTILSLLIPKKGIERRESTIKEINSFISNNWDTLLLGAKLIERERGERISFYCDYKKILSFKTLFYSKGGFKVKKSLELPSQEEILLVIKELEMLLSKAKEDLGKVVKIKIEEE